MEGILSQEEINALLSGGDLLDSEEEKDEEVSIVDVDYRRGWKYITRFIFNSFVNSFVKRSFYNYSKS